MKQHSGLSSVDSVIQSLPITSAGRLPAVAGWFKALRGLIRTQLSMLVSICMRPPFDLFVMHALFSTLIINIIKVETQDARLRKPYFRSLFVTVQPRLKRKVFFAAFCGKNELNCARCA